MIDKSKFYINGEWTNPIIKNDFEVINPSNESPYAFISLGSKEDVNIAVNAAKNAFLEWSQIDKVRRNGCSIRLVIISSNFIRF